MKTTLSKFMLGLVVALVIGLSATITLFSNHDKSAHAISDHVPLQGSYDMSFNSHYVKQSTYNSTTHEYEMPYEYYPQLFGINEGIYPIFDDYYMGVDMGSYLIYCYDLDASLNPLNYDLDFLTDITTIVLTYSYIFNEDYDDGTIVSRYNGSTYMELGFYYIDPQNINDEDAAFSDVMSCYRSFRLRVTEYANVNHMSQVTLTFSHKELGFTIDQFLNRAGAQDHGQVGIFVAMTSDLNEAYLDLYNNAPTTFLTPNIQLYSLPLEDVTVENGYSQEELDQWGDYQFDSGRLMGLDEGYSIGYDEGYVEGYEDGYDYATDGEPNAFRNYATVLTTAWQSATSILNTHVFGNLTILHLILIPLLLGVLLIILKLIRG